MAGRPTSRSSSDSERITSRPTGRPGDRLVAEPFLLVGIIASIKEIVIQSAFIKDDADINDTVLEIGVLGGVVLALCIGSLLLRRKEREREREE